MSSLPPVRLRSVRVVFGIGLGLSGLWVLLHPELLTPKPVGLPFDHNGNSAKARGSNDEEDQG
jgi:hypothetical protein